MFLIDYFRDKSEKREYRKTLNKNTPTAYVIYLNKGNPSFLAKENEIVTLHSKDAFNKFRLDNNLSWVDRYGTCRDAQDLMYSIDFIYPNGHRNCDNVLINEKEFNENYKFITDEEVAIFKKVGLMESDGIMRDPKALRVNVYNNYMKALKTDHKAYKIKGSNQPVWFFKINDKIIKSNTPIWNEFIALGGDSETITDWMLKEVKNE